MEIRIVGGAKTGKTIIATRIKAMLEEFGASVILNDLDKPKHVPFGSKPLSGQEVTVNVFNKPKEIWNEGN